MTLSSVVRIAIVAGALGAVAASGHAVPVRVDIEGPREDRRPPWTSADREGPREDVLPGYVRA